MLVIDDNPQSALTYQPHVANMAPVRMDGLHHMSHMGYLAARETAAQRAAAAAEKAKAADALRMSRLQRGNQTPAKIAQEAALQAKINVLSAGGTVKQANAAGTAAAKQTHAAATAAQKAKKDAGKASKGSPQAAQINQQLQAALNGLKQYLACLKQQQGSAGSASNCRPPSNEPNNPALASAIAKASTAPRGKRVLRGMGGMGGLGGFLAAIDDFFGLGKRRQGAGGPHGRMMHRRMGYLGQSVCPDGSPAQFDAAGNAICPGTSAPIGPPAGLMPGLTMPTMPAQTALPTPKGCKPGSTKPICLMYQLASDAQAENAQVMQQIIALEGEILQVLSQLQGQAPGLPGGQPISPFVDTGQYGLPPPGTAYPAGFDPGAGAPGIPIDSVPFGGGGGAYPYQGGGGDISTIPQGFDVGGGGGGGDMTSGGMPASIDAGDFGLPPIGNEYGLVSPMMPAGPPMELPQAGMPLQAASQPQLVDPGTQITIVQGGLIPQDQMAPSSPDDQGPIATTDPNVILAQSFDTDNSDDAAPWG